MPVLEKVEAASLASCSDCEPTWAEIMVISGMAAMTFSTRPTTRFGLLEGRADRHADLEHDHVHVLGRHEFRTQEGHDGQ